VTTWASFALSTAIVVRDWNAFAIRAVRHRVARLALRVRAIRNAAALTPTRRNVRPESVSIPIPFAYPLVTSALPLGNAVEAILAKPTVSPVVVGPLICLLFANPLVTPALPTVNAVAALLNKPIASTVAVGQPAMSASPVVHVVPTTINAATHWNAQAAFAELRFAKLSESFAATMETVATTWIVSATLAATFVVA
jgi:hypothetical protein